MICVRRCVFALTLVVVIAAARTGSAQLEQMAKFIPESANALMIIDVEALKATKLGQARDWESTLQKMHEDGLTSVPPDTKYYMIAAQLDLETHEPLWTVAVATLTTDPSMEDAAKARFAMLETILDYEAMITSDDKYIVKLGPSFFAAMAPGNRQSVSRWLRSSKNQTEPTLSPYLQDALNYVGELDTPIILALDLEGAISERFIRPRLEESAILDKRRDVDRDSVASTVAGIRGVTLGVTVDSSPYGAIKADFAIDVSVLRGISKFLFIEALENNGAYIDDFDNWSVRSENREVMLEGELSTNGLRRIMSILDQPVGQSYTADARSISTDSGEPDMQKIAVKTKAYFDGIQQHLDDLRSNRGSGRSWGQVGMWLDKYADRIDRLPMLGVDPEMIDYGQFVSSTMRNASMGIKQGNISSVNRQRQVYNEGVQVAGGGASGSGYGNWGGYRAGFGTGFSYYAENRNIDGERRAIRAEEKAASASNARTQMDQIKIEETQIRRTMTERYQIEF